MPTSWKTIAWLLTVVPCLPLGAAVGANPIEPDHLLNGEEDPQGYDYAQTMTYVNPSQGILSPASPCIVADAAGIELDVNYAGGCFYVPEGATSISLFVDDELFDDVGMTWELEWVCSGERLPLPVELRQPGAWFWVYVAGATNAIFDVDGDLPIDPACPNDGVKGTITALFHFD